MSHQKMTRPIFVVPAALLGLTLPLVGEDKITYADHARAVMENKCFSCHNPDKKKGDLDLTTFAGTMAGGSGGSIIDAGNPDGSKLIGTVTKGTEPFMPPEGAPLSPADIEVLKKWIAGGVLETANSVAKKSNKPKLDLNVAVGTGKPTGPIAKPEHVLLEPVVVTPRTTAVTAMAASPWTSLVAMAASKQILLYDTDTRQLAGVLPYEEGYARSLKFSRSGSLLVMGGGRGGKFGHAVVWDVKTGKRVAEIAKESDTIMSADISPDHSKVVIGSPSKKVKCFDLATGEELYTIAKHTEWILGTQFSPDGILLATCDRNGNVFVWEAENGGEFFLLGQHKGGACTSLSWRSDSNVLASASRDGTVILWEMNEGKQLKTWAAHGGGVEAVSFTPDGKVVTCGMDGLTRVWDINGNKLADLPSQGDVATSVVALADSKSCVVANWRGDVKVYSLESKTELGSLPSNPAKIDQRIADSERRIPELTAKVGPTQEAVKQADANVKVLDAALAKAKADAAANEARKNALPGEIKATEQAIAQAKAEREKAAKDKDALVARHKAYNETLPKVQEAEKQLAAAAPEGAKFAPVDQALNALKGQLEAAKKELAAKADDVALQTKVKDIEAKVAATTAEHAKLAPAKQKVDQLTAQVNQLKQQLGAAPAPVADADKAIAAIDAKLKTANETLAARKAELPKVEQAAKNFPNVVKDAEGKLAKGREALVAAQTTAKATTDELAIMQRLVPSLRAAKFNVGVLAEKDALAKLESDFQAYTDGLKENEDARAAALQRIEDSKKAIAETTAAIPGLDAAAAKLLGELQPVEKAFTETKTVSDQAAGKVNEQKQIIATKEAEIAALAKARDDAAAAAKVAAEAISKEIAKQQPLVKQAEQKLAAPAKTVEDRKAAVARIDGELAQAKQAAATAKTTAEQTEATIKPKEEALAKAKVAKEAADKDSTALQQTATKAANLAKPAKEALVAKEAALLAAKQGSKPEAAALETEVADLRTKAAAAEKEAADRKAAADAAVKTQETRKAELAAANKAMDEARSAAKQAKNALAQSTSKAADRERALAEAKKNLTAAEKAAAPLIAALKQANDKLVGAQKALAEKQAAPAALQKDFEGKSAPLNAVIATAKAALPPLEKTAADTLAKTNGDLKVLEAKRAEVGAAQASASEAKKKKATAEKTIVDANKEIPDRDKNIAEAKGTLAKLQPQLEPQRSKVKQLNDQYLTLLPK